MFGTIEIKVNKQLMRAGRAIEVDASLNYIMWDDFNNVLDDCLYTAKSLAQKQYALHDRLPKQELINKIQLLCEWLTSLKYGKPNINRFFLFLMRLHEEAQLNAYNAPVLTQTLKKSHDGYISVSNATIRSDPVIKHHFADLNNEHAKLYSPMNIAYGKNPLDKIFPPSVITQEQFLFMLRRKHWMRVGLKLLGLYLGKTFENWGQVDPVVAQKWLSRIKTSTEEMNEPAVKRALYYQEKLSERFVSESVDLRLIDQGVAQGKLIKANTLRLGNDSPNRYATFSWKRSNHFKFLDRHGDVKVGRHANIHEYHRVIPNQLPYYNHQGLVVSGSPDNIHDPQANQPNARLDIEKLMRTIEFFNPATFHDLSPGEEILFGFQNPPIVSSIKATEHCHLARADIASFYVLKLFPIRMRALHRGNMLNIIQLGSCEDSLILDFTYHEITPELIQCVQDINLDLHAHFSMESTLICFPHHGVFHLLLLPINKMVLDHEQKALINARGQTDVSLGIYTYDCHPHPALGLFRVRFDGVKESALINQGQKAVEIYGDFIAVEGLKNHLNAYLDNVDRPKSVANRM